LPGAENFAADIGDRLVPPVGERQVPPRCPASPHRSAAARGIKRQRVYIGTMGSTMTVAPNQQVRPVQLLACDLDGTVIAHGDSVHEPVLAALHAAVDDGVRVIIATGRMARSVEIFRQLWKLPGGPMICYNGAEVVDLPAGHQWFCDRLPDAAARQAMELVLAEDYLAQVYVGDALWVTREDPRIRQYVEANHIPAEVRPGRTIVDWSLPPIKILIQDEPPALARLRAQLEPWAAAAGIRTFYSQRDYLEIASRTATKGQALARVAERLGVPQSAVAAVGDGENDAEMLAWAGLGMAMGGGHPAAVAAADVVLPSVADDGVAEGIYRYLLNRGGE